MINRKITQDALELYDADTGITKDFSIEDFYDFIDTIEDSPELSKDDQYLFDAIKNIN